MLKQAIQSDPIQSVHYIIFSLSLFKTILILIFCFSLVFVVVVVVLLLLLFTHNKLKTIIDKVHSRTYAYMCIYIYMCVCIYVYAMWCGYITWLVLFRFISSSSSTYYNSTSSSFDDDDDIVWISVLEK